MPKEKTGKIIKKIRVNKKNIVLTFTDGEKLEISEDAYTSNYLFPGKELTNKELDRLNIITSVKKLSEYAISLLSKGHYTEWKIRDKLYNKGGEKESVDYVINRLKSVDLINDKAFIEDYLGYAEERGFGKNKIKQELIKKGIFAEEIEKIRFNETSEKRKAVSLIPSLEKRYSKYSYELKKRHIYGALLSKGFDSEVASYALNKISNKNDIDEKEKLKIDFKKTYEKYKRKYEGRELKEKVINHLRSKGYRFNDINKIIGEDYDF